MQKRGAGLLLSIGDYASNTDNPLRGVLNLNELGTTNRRLEVGADATDARAANPGSDVLTEDPGYSLSPEPNLVTLFISGKVVEKGIDPDG
jgi:hypothetical protein